MRVRTLLALALLCLGGAPAVTAVCTLDACLDATNDYAGTVESSSWNAAVTAVGISWDASVRAKEEAWNGSICVMRASLTVNTPALVSCTNTYGRAGAEIVGGAYAAADLAIAHADATGAATSRYASQLLA